MAAFLAAAERPAEPFVLAALRAAAARADAVRCEAARCACFESAARDTVRCGSRLSAFDTARETRGRRRVFRLPWPASYAYSALLRVLALTLPFPGGRRATDGNRLLWRPRSMLTAANPANLLMYKFAGLRGGRFARALVPPSLLDCSSFRHDYFSMENALVARPMRAIGQATSAVQASGYQPRPIPKLNPGP